MKFPTIAERTVPCLGLTLALALGCLPDPSDGDSDRDSDTTTVGATGTDTDGAPTTSETTGDPVEGPLPCEAEPGLLQGAGVIAEPSIEEPNDISLTLSNEGLTCESPDQESLMCVGEWFVRILIPPAMQKPGVYALEDLSTLALSGKETCDGAIGGQTRGTLEITAIDGAEIQGRLCHLEGRWVDDNPTNGTEFNFVAPRCP